MVSIANQSGPVAKAGTDTGERASVSTPNTIAVMNIGGIGGSITKNMVSPAGVEFESRNEGPGQAPGLIFWSQGARRSISARCCSPRCPDEIDFQQFVDRPK